MSPAKRLSRKRFRVLCERCRAFLHERDQSATGWRALRFGVALVRANMRVAHPRPRAAAIDTMRALARLAR